MTLPVLICDDSSFARKQMARALPDDWQMDISFAENGVRAIEAIRAGKADILFLDLNMPIMDGFRVLQEIQKQDLNTLVVVVSGDVQPSTRDKVLKLGALDFIPKPVDSEVAGEVFRKFGLLDELKRSHSELALSDELLDVYREITNIAMGQAAVLLGQFLNSNVTLSVPRVEILKVSSLYKRLLNIDNCHESAAVVQGFIGAGIAGETWLFFNHDDFDYLSELTHLQSQSDDELEKEISTSISNILIGSCLKSIGKQLDIYFSEGCPTLLGHMVDINTLFTTPRQVQETLAVDIEFSLESHDIHWSLLLLFTDDSLEKLQEKISCLM